MVLLSFGACRLTALDKLEYEFKGVHFMAEYCECDEQALTDIETLKKVVHEAALASGATILESVDHLFPPHGLTLVILLSESHASIHTYPEHKSCFVDLFTCGDHCSANEFDAVLRAYLKPITAHHKTLIRSETINDVN
ncbi:MAG TPA: adenosylmethionine decarboxylase [Rhabdochlamydiaceae bacterium]|nr:adenosylmethionine decarboxylase [Rhabdochlamydiaceae bacterium]